MLHALITRTASAVLAVYLSVALHAQCAVQPRAGCPGEGAPVCVGRISSSTGFQIACPAMTIPCSGGSSVVTLFGTCAPTAVVDVPIGCGACALVVAPWGTFNDPITVPPGLPVGATFCMQCGCVAVPRRGALCVNLSQAVNVTILP